MMHKNFCFERLNRSSCKRARLFGGPRHLRGVTLVGMMVGLLISMFIVLGMLSVFRTVVGVTVQARQDSGQDDRRASAFMRITMEVQDAGFGVDNPVYGQQLLVLNNASLGVGNVGLSGTPSLVSGTSAVNSGNALLWAVHDPSAVAAQCAGFLYKAATDASAQLLHLPLVNCAGDMTDLATLTWAPQVWLQGSSAAQIVQASATHVHGPAMPVIGSSKATAASRTAIRASQGATGKRPSRLIAKAPRSGSRSPGRCRPPAPGCPG